MERISAMKYLLDTHTFLWFINDSQELKETIKKLLESNIDLWLSIVSLWEIAIKKSLRKLELPDSYEKFISNQLAINDIEILPITLKHLSRIINLPFHHKDPFDRLLIAQAIIEEVPIISKDQIFDSYSIERIW